MRLYRSKHEKKIKEVAKNRYIWKSAKKGSVDYNPSRNDEASFRPNISENKEERTLPEGGRGRSYSISEERYKKQKELISSQSLWFRVF